jgi:hypothetical protein
MAKKPDPAVDVHFIPTPAVHVTAGVKAMAAGTASEHQQREVLAWLISACGTYDQTWRPGPEGVRLTDFASGKRAIGLAIVRELNRVLNREPIQPPLKGENTHG